MAQSTSAVGQPASTQEAERGGVGVAGEEQSVILLGILVWSAVSGHYVVVVLLVFRWAFIARKR